MVDVKCFGTTMLRFEVMISNVGSLKDSTERFSQNKGFME
jgi:hypothetical protein